LPAPEVGEQHRVEPAGGDARHLGLVELFLEDDLVREAGPGERRRGDRGAGEAVGVDV